MRWSRLVLADESQPSPIKPPWIGRAVECCASEALVVTGWTAKSKKQAEKREHHALALSAVILGRRSNRERIPIIFGRLGLDLDPLSDN